MGLISVLSFAQKCIAERIQPGAIVIDATVGNGVDTSFLAQLVGTHGTVYGFDIQAIAIANTRTRLNELGWFDERRIQLFATGHQNLLACIASNHIGQVSAVMFNLGYLPGGTEQQTITLPETTLIALESSCVAVKKGGIITVVLYPGHEGGEREASAVEQWTKQLPQNEYDCVRYQFINRAAHAPYIIVIEKK